MHAGAEADRLPSAPVLLVKLQTNTADVVSAHLISIDEKKGERSPYKSSVFAAGGVQDLRWWVF